MSLDLGAGRHVPINKSVPFSQEFVAREVENYKKVMEGYCCAVRGMGFGEVEWVLYFIAMDEWAEKAYLIQKIDQIYSQKEEVSDDKNK